MYIARYEADDLFGHDNAEHESVLRKSETNRTYRKTRGREENPVLYFTLLGKWLTEQRLGKRVQKGKFLLQKKKLWRAMINTIEEVNLFYSLKIRLFFLEGLHSLFPCSFGFLCQIFHHLLSRIVKFRCLLEFDVSYLNPASPAVILRYMYKDN